MHQRQAIRDAVITLLSGNTTVADNVTKNIVKPLLEETLPWIVVYSTTEDVEEINRSPRDIKRTLQLAIEIHVTSTNNDTLQDTLDDIALEVENIMAVDHTLTDTCDDHILQNVEIEYRGEAAQPIAMCRMTYAVQYITAVPASSDDQTTVATITDFSGADVDYNIGHNDSSPDDQIEAEDTIDLEVEV